MVDDEYKNKTTKIKITDIHKMGKKKNYFGLSWYSVD